MDGGKTMKDTQSPPANSITKPKVNAVETGKRQISPGSLPLRSWVTNMDFDVTENCNLGCGYCFKGEMYARHMSPDMMRKAFDWLLVASGPATSVNCNFMGGEPTMRFKQIKAFVPWAKRRGMDKGKTVTFSMTTNLTLFTDEIRRFVDKHGFGVLMSIDGCPDVQDAQRPAKNGKPMSDVVAKWARSMLQTRPRCQARATLHPDYVDRIFDSVSYIQDLGFAEVAISASCYEEWTPEHFDVLRSQYKYIEELEVESLRKGSGFLRSSTKYYASKLIHLRRTKQPELIEPRWDPCGAGKGYMMVDYTGDIWPCHRFDGADADAGADGAFRLGNIFEEGFNDPLQKAFVDFDHSRNHKDACSTCPVNEVCGGYCPAANISDTGSLYTPHDAFCEWSQTTYASAENVYQQCEKEEHEHGLLSKLLELGKTSNTAGDR